MKRKKASNWKEWTQPISRLQEFLQATKLRDFIPIDSRECSDLLSIVVVEMKNAKKMILFTLPVKTDLEFKHENYALFFYSKKTTR